MENSQKHENISIYGDVVEEPLMLICGEGSGEDCQVGNDEKTNIFFFGQPGCLKHSPIKTFSTEKITGLSSFKTSSSSSDKEIESKEKSEENSENSSIKNSNNDVNIIENQSTQNDVTDSSAEQFREPLEEFKDESNKSNNENDLKLPPETKTNDSVDAQDDQPTEMTEENSEKVNENTHSTGIYEHNCETLPSKHTADGNVQLKKLEAPKLSIVPYDDDDSTSSSQAESVNQNSTTDENEQAKSEKPATIESASLVCESAENASEVNICEKNILQINAVEKMDHEKISGDTIEKTETDISNVAKPSKAEEAIRECENVVTQTTEVEEVCQVEDNDELNVQLRTENENFECDVQELKISNTEQSVETPESTHENLEATIENEKAHYFDATSENREEEVDEKLSSQTPVDSEIFDDNINIDVKTNIEDQIEKNLDQIENENEDELQDEPENSVKVLEEVDEKLCEEKNTVVEVRDILPVAAIEDSNIQSLQSIPEENELTTSKSDIDQGTRSVEETESISNKIGTSDEQPETSVEVEFSQSHHELINTNSNSQEEISEELPSEINEEKSNSPFVEQRNITEEIIESQESVEDLSESKIEEIEKTETDSVAKQGEILNEIQRNTQLDEAQNESIEVGEKHIEEFIENSQSLPTFEAETSTDIDHDTEDIKQIQEDDSYPQRDLPIQDEIADEIISHHSQSPETFKISDEEPKSFEQASLRESQIFEEKSTSEEIPETIESNFESFKSEEVDDTFPENSQEVEESSTHVEDKSKHEILSSVNSPESQPDVQEVEKDITSNEEITTVTEPTLVETVVESIEQPIELSKSNQEHESEAEDDDDDHLGSLPPASPAFEKDDDEEEHEEPEQPLAPVVVENQEEVITSPEVHETIKEPPQLEELEDEPENFSKPSQLASTRKRKLSERKSISESDSDSNVAIESVTQEHTSEDEIIVKKPRMRNKTTTPKKVPVATRSLRGRKSAKSPERQPEETTNESSVEIPLEQPKVDENIQESEPVKAEEPTLQNLQFDYDESEDIAAKVAAIKTLICKDKKSSESEQSDDEKSNKKLTNKRSRKGKRGRFSKAKAAESSDEDNKRKKPSSEQSEPTKKRNSGRGLLKYIDTSLVIETVENEAPVRQSRRIAQIKIKEETERRQVEEKLLIQMKTDAAKKKKPSIDGDYQKSEESSEDEADDESVKGRRKKKSTIKKSDKQWQTSSSHSEHSDQSEDELLEHVRSDPGSPLFKSDHEFSPESEDEDDVAQVQPLKRARTAKKIEVEDQDEDINPNHACQVCHKTDSPEWILLCDECDCGYHCSCLKPIIFLIPSGNWYCPKCCHKQLIGNLSEQLTKLDTLVQNIETAELRRQRQIMLEISAQNIIEEERRKKERDRTVRSPPKTARADSEGSGSSHGSSSDSDSSDDAPLIYKLRKRNQTNTSYRFNEYDDLINSAIKEEMDEVKGAGNLGRGKDISTIIEADREEKRNLKRDLDGNEEEGSVKGEEEGNSSGSDVIRMKKSDKRKKKTRRLNTLDSSDDAQSDADESFKGSTPSSDSEIDEEELSMSSVSESSLDLPKKKGGSRSLRTRTRQKRIDHFINDNDSNDSDDEPLIVKRTRKKKDSDEEEFDLNDDDDDDENSAEEDIDSDDLCDDTDSSDSSESAWPKKKKKRVASYDQKPRKPAKKKLDEEEDKAFRAGISKKKILKQQQLSQMSENESEGSDDAKSRRTRGKKLLYLIEDDLESDESDGIRPGVKRPETPPEEREMFFKKQEEIKRMLAAKDTEAAKKLAVPTIEPINIPIERPETPSSIPSTDEPSSLSTIPMNVIESAKALDTDYNRAKPFLVGSSSKLFTPEKSSKDMDETELARMMEDEDFARHQLKLAGDAIAKKKLLEFEAKEDAFIGASRSTITLKDKETPTPEKQKRSKKPKVDKTLEESPQKALHQPQLPSQHQSAPMPATQQIPVPSIPPPMHSMASIQKPIMQHHPIPPQLAMQQQSMMANYMHQPPHSQPSIIQQTPYVPSQQNLPPSQLMSDRPSVLSNYMNRPLSHPSQQPHMKMLQSQSPPALHHHPMKPLQSPPPGIAQQMHHPKAFSPKSHQPPPMPLQQPVQQLQMQDVEMKKERKKKQASSRPEPMPEGNIPKHVKLDAPASVIHPPMNSLIAERLEDKGKLSRTDHNMKLSVASPPQIFNPGTASTPSVITRLLQPQNRPPNPYSQVPSSQAQHHQPPPGVPNVRMYQMSESQQKHLPPVTSGKVSSQQNLPPTSFADHHAFVPRSIHHSLYRGPAPFGIPPHSRLPPYPFPLHPNLRPGEFSASPYNIPPQFGYYAPPAHGRPGPMPPALHGAAPHMAAGNEDHSNNSIRNPNNSEENPENSSEFGGLVSYFSSQQELD